MLRGLTCGITQGFLVGLCGVFGSAKGRGGMVERGDFRLGGDVVMLRSYSFQEFDERIWLLFHDMMSSSKEFDCSIEVVTAAIRGKIDLDKVESELVEAEINGVGLEGRKKTFSLLAYDAKVRRNRKLAAGESAKKNLRIVELNDGEESQPYGVSEGVVTLCADKPDEYGACEDEIDLQFALRGLQDSFRDILVWCKVDVWLCMEQALKGIPESVALLKNLVQEFPYVGEYVRVILSCGKPFGELKAMIV